MTPTLLIAWRFLKAAPRAFALGVAGIALGVAFFILTQAQTSGFEKFFIKTILGSSGAIRIAEKYQSTQQNLSVEVADARIDFKTDANRTYVEGVDFPEALRAEVEKYSGVTGVSEVVEGRVDALCAGRSQAITVNGIRLFDQLKVSALASQIVAGQLEHFQSRPNPLIIGARLANRFDLQPGERVVLKTATGSYSGEVVAIFQTGVSDIDLQRIYMPIGDARALLKKPFGGGYLQISLADPAKAPAIASSIEEAYHYHAISWQEREKVWLEVFGALKVSAALTVCSILAIASMGIFNTLAMMVMEKTRQIAILAAMGYRARDIRAIFMWQGAFLGGVGVAAGVVLGALSTALVEHLPLKIRGIFAADHFVVSWDISHYLWAVALAAIAVCAATLLPAQRAARLQPADILRGGAQ